MAPIPAMASNPAVPGHAVSGPALASDVGTAPVTAAAAVTEVTASAADGPVAPATSAQTDRMGVVLRLPSLRGRAGTSTIEPAVFAGSESSDPGLLAEDPGETERTDRAWVEEWRAGGEPTPWATGLVLVVFSALVVGVAMWVLSAGLADRPVVAVLVNLLVAGGLTPAIWLSRGLPVLRWVGAGAAIGIVIGWITALLMLPLPTP